MRNQIRKICKVCGSEFTVTPARDNAICCSLPCLRKHQSRYKVKRPCAICGTEFITTEKELAVGKGKYCSWKCYQRSPTVSWGYASFRDDLGHFCRSAMEANFCRILVYLGIPYEYEPDRLPVELDGKTYTYVPDLKLDQDTYVEIKGWWRRERQKRKVQEFQKQYPIRLHIVETPLYRRYLKRYGQLAENIEWVG